MLLYAYFTPRVDFKRKFNHHQSFLYELRLTARTIQKFRIGPSIRIESRIGRTIRNRIESRSFAGPYTRQFPLVEGTRAFQLKLATIVYSSLNGMAPYYLAADLHPLSDMLSRRRLRSSLTNQLDVLQSQCLTVTPSFRCGWCSTMELSAT